MVCGKSSDSRISSIASNAYCRRKPCSCPAFPLHFPGKIFRRNVRTKCPLLLSSGCPPASSSIGAMPSSCCRYAAIRLLALQIGARRRDGSQAPVSARTVCSVLGQCDLQFHLCTQSAASHSVAKDLLPAVPALPCKSDVSVLWMLDRCRSCRRWHFSVPASHRGASRNRITRIYSPATAFMHLPAQPAPTSSVSDLRTDTGNAERRCRRSEMRAFPIRLPSSSEAPRLPSAVQKTVPLLAAMHFTASAMQSNSA